MNKNNYLSQPLLSFAIGLVVFTTLVMVQALDALGQVNGPGTSDSALFDNVINLPPDPSIGNNDGIGGVPGMTTQLNVDDGGSIGFFFDADAGTEVNIDGGQVGNGFDANSGSEINIRGGSLLAFDAGPGSLVDISGGSLGTFFAEGGSDVSISGGSFNNNFSARNGSNLDISGGVFNDQFTANSGSTVNLSGGLFNDAVSLSGGSNVVVSGGLFGDDFSASGVELIGGEFFLNNNPLANGGNVSFNDGDLSLIHI